MKLSFGPGALVAAAFIGPGTVTACTVAGASFGHALVWALVFATLATIVLQDMAARLGAGARRGLGEALMASVGGPVGKAGAVILVLLAIGVGNAAYEGGNLAGGVMGLEALLGEGTRRLLVAGLAIIAAGILLIGAYKPIERILIGLVLVMSLAFIISAILVRPDLSTFAGLVPSIPDGAQLTAVALIGTTIVPYNLFLHAAAARNHWTDASKLSEARRDSAISIGLGGLVSILILSTAAGSLFVAGMEVNNARDMAIAIEPAFGPAARYLVGIGLFAAGLTSAITAPMATAYAITEMFPAKSKSGQTGRFRAIALTIVAIGAAISLLGIDAVSLIVTAQAANGLLLPIIAVFLLYVMNREALLGDSVNGIPANIAGGLVILITLMIGLRGIWRALSTVLGA
ncbi:NRAMP family divalent metal transporter [Henriciella marina]|uniref:Divalent metal cation transporter n=1 Tax=Henriciella marina TaxID=453851 RepID=A0ABT4LQ53_9PROT|nr:divalent metal cation transporter [Henriciella marina]MCZ4296496.1 divalent metal cation transporter [Henriciella marina]